MARQELQFDELQHSLWFRLAISPPPGNEALEYPRLSSQEAEKRLKEFEPALCNLVSDFYGGAEIKKDGEKHGKKRSLTVYVVDETDKVLAQILFAVEKYNSNDKQSEEFTPVAFLDAGVEDYPSIHHLMSLLNDKIVLRKKLKIEGGGKNILCYTLLAESKPTEIKRECYLTDGEVFRRIGFGIDVRRLYK